MTHRAKRGVSWRIDRTFLGVGRMAIASGTDHAPTFKRINAMLTGLYKIGRLDILALIKQGVHAPLVCLHAYERGQLDKLPTGATAVALVPSLKKFAETHECGESYRSDLETSIRHIEKAAPKSASVADLPRLVRAMKDAFRDRPVAFNRLRTHMLAFASETEGKHSALWVALTNTSRFKKAEGQRPKKLQRRPLTVAELDAVCAAFTDHVVHGGRKGAHNKGKLAVRRIIPASQLADMTRVLATTGMRPAEYWLRNGAGWTPETTHIQVNGTKTAAAKRPTFMIGLPWPAFCGEQFFRARFAEATTKALRVGLDTYSLRRTFAKLCEDAGVVQSRRETYMGHGPRTVDELYLRTEVLPFVAQDAERVASHIAAERATAKGSSHLKLEAGR